MQACQDQSIYCTLALSNTVTVGVAGALRLVGTGIGGVLGFLVMLRTGLATRCAPSLFPCLQGGREQPLVYCCKLLRLYLSLPRKIMGAQSSHASDIQAVTPKVIGL